jgi:large subunit ribosomal protein L3
MSKGLIGKKLGMTSVFTQDGQYLPVTVILAGPCVVTQIKTVETDGYNALQVGFGEKKESRTTKPLKGHFKKSGGRNFAFLKEVEVDNPEDYTLGQTIGPDLFKIGERVDVIGTTKGRGFAGVMKRHGFGGGRMSHGSKCKRIPGSIGCSAWPAKVVKGKKLPGHYGVDRKTVRNLEIVDIRPDENLIMVKGPVPGHRQSMVMLKKLKFATNS